MPSAPRILIVGSVAGGASTVAEASLLVNGQATANREVVASRIPDALMVGL